MEEQPRKKKSMIVRRILVGLTEEDVQALALIQKSVGVLGETAAIRVAITSLANKLRDSENKENN